MKMSILLRILFFPVMITQLCLIWYGWISLYPLLFPTPHVFFTERFWCMMGFWVAAACILYPFYIKDSNITESRAKHNRSWEWKLVRNGRRQRSRSSIAYAGTARGIRYFLMLPFWFVYDLARPQWFPHENRDLQLFDVTTRSVPEGTIMKISGEIFESDLIALRNLKVVICGNVLQLNLGLTHARKEYPFQDFSLEFKLPPFIEKVTVSPNNYVIWEKDEYCERIHAGKPDKPYVFLLKDLGIRDSDTVTDEKFYRGKHHWRQGNHEKSK